MKKTLTLLLALGSAVTAAVDNPPASGNGYGTNENREPTTTYYVNAPDNPDNNSFVYEISQNYDNDGTQDGRINGAVHIGSETEAESYDVPVLTPNASQAERYVVGPNGTLIFVGRTTDATGTTTQTTGGLTVEQFLTTTTGTGNLVLRTPDQEVKVEDLESKDPLKVNLSAATTFEGNLLISPAPVVGTDATGGSLFQQSHVYLSLQDQADISSFDSVVIGSAESVIRIDGEITKGENKAGHINNFTMVGASGVKLYLNSAANEEVRLGGNTILANYDYTGSSECPSILYADFDANTTLRIDKLQNTGYSELLVSTGLQTHQVNADRSIDSKFFIDSFEYEGVIQLHSYINGSLEGSITLLKNDTVHQKMNDWQLQGHFHTETAPTATQTVTLNGGGTYVLTEGLTILPSTALLGYKRNFATLGTNWEGTVEVNKLSAGIDFADYGNENSTVHFKGFKGAVGTRTSQNTSDISVGENNQQTIATNLVLENVPSEGTVGSNSYEEGMYGFELTGTPGNAAQTQTYTGNISGTGDFVINTEAELDVAFTGNIADWKAANDKTPQLLVQKGEHNVSFGGNATVINTDLKTAGGSMHAEIGNTTSQPVTVNGTVSHEAGGYLGITVDENTTVTFNNTVDVDKLVSVGTSKVGDSSSFTVGNVVISDRSTDNDATLSGGTTISANSVSGGTVEHALVNLTDGAELSLKDVTLGNTTVTANSGATVNLSNVTANAVFYNNVQLSGADVNYTVMDAAEFTADGNNLSLSISALSGMTLTDEANAIVTLGSAIPEGWNPPTDTTFDITITLQGFVLESLLAGVQPTDGLYQYSEERPDKWQDDLELKNALLDALNLENATITYTQWANSTDMQAREYNSMFNHLTINISGAQISSIPEPTTATLSLLALAALAARRRRK